MNKNDTKKELEQALRFAQSAELGTKMSPLWEEMSKDFNASQKYSFDTYPLEAYEEHQKQVDINSYYENYNSKNNIFFSHNNYKSFTYFHTLMKYIDLEDLESKNILEIKIFSTCTERSSKCCFYRTKENQ